MPMTLADIRQLSRGTYGLEWSVSEDSLYTNPLLNKLINKAHHWFAGITRCYYNDAISQALTTNTASYALDPTVIEPDVRTFRLAITGVFTRLRCRLPHSLMEERGALESVAAATPTDFYIRAGTVNAAAKKVELVPKPNAAAGTGNGTLWYGAWVYPAELAADGDLVPLADPDVYRLVSAINWQLSEFDASRGRPDAPVKMWSSRALAEAVELQRIIRFGTREFGRTAEVGASPLDDVTERRHPPSIYGGGQG